MNDLTYTEYMHGRDTLDEIKYSDLETGQTTLDSGAYEMFAGKELNCD